MTMDIPQAVCPCCGGPMRDLPVKWMPEARIVVRGERAVILSRNYALMFDRLWAGRRRANGGATRHELFAAMYDHDPNGGPNYGTHIVSVMMSRLRTFLSPLGLTVGHAPVYRLMELTDDVLPVTRKRAG